MMQKRTSLKGLLKLFFAIYILVVIKVIIFKYPMEQLRAIAATWQKSVILEGLDTANFVPFRTIKMYIDYAHKLNSVENLAGNILVFVPLGFMLPLLSEDMRKLWVVLVNAFTFVLGIEVFQLFSAFGAFDVDDILLNCLGAAIGYGCYRIIEETKENREYERGIRMGNLLRRLKTNIVISAVLCVILGIVLVVWPDLSMKVVCTAIGAVLVVGGLTRLVGYFLTRDGSMYAQMSLIMGIVLTVVGVWIVLKPEKVLVIIPIIIGIVIVLHGLNNLQQAVALHRDQYDKWWVALILGLLTVGFGVLLICRPFAALDTVVMLIGIFLIYDGISDIWIVSRVYKTAKALRQEAEALDVEAQEVE